MELFNFYSMRIIHVNCEGISDIVSCLRRAFPGSQYAEQPQQIVLSEKDFQRYESIVPKPIHNSKDWTKKYRKLMDGRLAFFRGVPVVTKEWDKYPWQK